MLSSIPDVKLFCLSCSSEAEALIAQAIEEFAQARKNNQTPSSYVFFLGRENFPRTFVTEQKYKLGEAQIVFDNTKVSNKKVCLIAVGSTLVQSLKAAQELENKGIACKLVNASSINHVDKNTIFKAIADCQNNLVIVEDHQRIGGFSSILSQELCQNAIAAKLITLAVDCKFGQSAYTANELYAKHGLDDQAIVKAASSFFM